MNDERVLMCRPIYTVHEWGVLATVSRIYLNILSTQRLKLWYTGYSNSSDAAAPASRNRSSLLHSIFLLEFVNDPVSDVMNTALLEKAYQHTGSVFNFSKAEFQNQEIPSNCNSLAVIYILLSDKSVAFSTF